MLRERYSGEITLRFDVNSRSQPSDQASDGSVIFVNRYFYPDHSATSVILSDLAFHLVGFGHVVRVFAISQGF
jgi:hypothetical protein